MMAASDQAPALVLGEGVSPNWENARGFLRYHDLRGSEWQTHFRCQVDAWSNRSIQVIAVGSTDEFGEPAYNAEEGWVNKPDGVELWHATA